MMLMRARASRSRRPLLRQMSTISRFSPSGKLFNSLMQGRGGTVRARPGARRHGATRAAARTRARGPSPAPGTPNTACGQPARTGTGPRCGRRPAESAGRAVGASGRRSGRYLRIRPTAAPRAAARSNGPAAPALRTGAATSTPHATAVPTADPRSALTAACDGAAQWPPSRTAVWSCSSRDCSTSPSAKALRATSSRVRDRPGSIAGAGEYGLQPHFFFASHPGPHVAARAAAGREPGRHVRDRGRAGLQIHRRDPPAHQPAGGRDSGHDQHHGHPAPQQAQPDRPNQGEQGEDQAQLPAALPHCHHRRGGCRPRRAHHSRRRPRSTAWPRLTRARPGAPDRQTRPGARGRRRRARR